MRRPIQMSGHAGHREDADRPANVGPLQMAASVTHQGQGSMPEERGCARSNPSEDERLGEKIERRERLSPAEGRRLFDMDLLLLGRADPGRPASAFRRTSSTIRRRVGPVRSSPTPKPNLHRVA